jgi:pyruvate dehydrogenase E2 component (dihydrolipoamide acetyltransferase)
LNIIMAHLIEMPKFSDDMAVGTVGRWLKSEGDHVKFGDPLADIETDKATLELESQFEGTLLKRFAPEGAKVPVDSPLCLIGEPGEKIETIPARSEALLPPVGSTIPEEIVGKTERDGSGLPVHPRVSVAPQIDGSGAPALPNKRMRVSPLARKLAKMKGIDLAGLTGSGPRGRILRIDVLAAEKQMGRAAPKAPVIHGVVVAAQRLETAAPERSIVGSDRIVPNSPMRTAIARRLVESKTQIPHFYLEMEVDAAPLLILRTQLNAVLAKEGTRLSVNDFILKASAFALLKVPEVNGSWGGDHIRFHRDINVSFAVAIEDGLITPVVRETERKSVVAISGETKALAARAREKKLLPTEFNGGTFCVTNLGMMGITRFSAIINPPNSAILAVGATVRKPVVHKDEIVIGDRLTLTLSCDHRVVDGATGARFLNELQGFLDCPLRLLCDPPLN